MKVLKRSLPVFCLLTLPPFLMAAITVVDINTPAAGSGAEWDVSTIYGTADGAPNESMVFGLLYKWDGMKWSDASPLGPLWLAETDNLEAWETTPDLNQVTPDFNDGGSPPVLKFTTAGLYKVKVIVFDFMSMTSKEDSNQWTIP